MLCPQCKSSKMIVETGTYHYTECGLDNIYLDGIEIYRCSCGEEIVNIPLMLQLHDYIGTTLINKKSLLRGPEIKFLRKNMGLTAIKFADYLGVNNATISRWENNKQSIEISHDRSVRLIYSIIKSIPANQIKNLIEDKFIEILPNQTKTDIFNISVDRKIPFYSSPLLKTA